MPSQRPFLATFFAAFRQQPAASLPSAAQQPNKHSTSQPSAAGFSSSASQPRTISTTAAAAAAVAAAASQSASSQGGVSAPRPGTIASQLPLHSPRAHAGIPIPNQQAGGSAAAAAVAAGRRRGSDSSSEGFRDVMGADKWYIGGRTATGEERFFKLGVVRRVRSGDRLSLDRLSL